MGSIGFPGRDCCRARIVEGFGAAGQLPFTCVLPPHLHAHAQFNYLVVSHQFHAIGGDLRDFVAGNHVAGFEIFSVGRISPDKKSHVSLLVTERPDQSEGLRYRRSAPPDATGTRRTVGIKNVPLRNEAERLIIHARGRVRALRAAGRAGRHQQRKRHAQPSHGLKPFGASRGHRANLRTDGKTCASCLRNSRRQPVRERVCEARRTRRPQNFDRNPFAFPPGCCPNTFPVHGCGGGLSSSPLICNASESCCPSLSRAVMSIDSTFSASGSFSTS